MSNSISEHLMLSKTQHRTDRERLLLLLIDKSGSMSEVEKTTGVIDGQTLLLDALSGSNREDRAMLKVAQVQFNGEAHPLHDFAGLDELDSQGKPIVKRSLKGVYTPNGEYTAVYDMIIDAIDAAEQYVGAQADEGRIVEVYIALLTDGQNNGGKTRQPTPAAKRIQGFTEHDKQHFFYIGIGEHDHKAIAASLSVEPRHVISVNATAHDIRQAFALLGSLSLELMRGQRSGMN